MRMRYDWIRLADILCPSLLPFDDYVEVVREGDWESMSTIYIGNESGRFWHHRKEPGFWKWQGYTFHAKTAVDALYHLIALVERVESEGRI